METVTTIITFLMVVINLATMSALLIGLNFSPSDKTCPDELKEISRNKLFLKLVVVFDFISSCVLLIDKLCM